MCGIAAIIRFDHCPPSRDALHRLSDSMRHRGPDDEGLFVHENVGLAFRRLSIIDLSRSGHQPMESDSGRFVIVFNGEIFNYLELRAELEALGYKFRSNSDTEVLLNAYIEWDVACLDKFNGMWAFAILDKHTGRFFCARDRFGVKPLYYLRTAKCMVFASEVAAILRSGIVRPAVDRSTVAQYLFFGDLDCGEGTFYEGITAVAPGTWMSIDGGGRIRSGAYWKLPDDVAAKPDFDELYELFHDGVKIRLRSDVPVGVFLSGGLDSTSILCAAARQLGRDAPISAFAFMSPDYDESRYIADTIAQTGAELVRLDVDSSKLWDELTRMVEYQDGPVHTPSALIGFCLCRLAASRGIKVILNGQGADETLAGYPNYFANYWQSLLGGLQFLKLLAQLEDYGGQHHIRTMLLLRRVIARFVKVKLNRVYAYQWVAAMHHRRSFRAHPFYDPALVDSLPHFHACAGNGGLDEALRRSVTISPLPLYLRVEDRNSMAHSIEVRLPFLDYRLVSAVMRIADVRKLEGFWNKILLRETMRGRIPESVRVRPDKMGFATPDAKWIRSWAGEIEAIFRSRTFAERGFFNVPNLLAALRDHVNGVRECHEDIFRAVQVEQYLRIAERTS
ncbi:MAG: asparagine synthase (glutamine-hydrolyzing) [Rhodanobacteraceae bacterium]|nr:MAG: asparagine synthase (glutamine-hydrolyzing) [Rhodanobacteraceae bacterium]